ncbi:hypothetical protein MU852_10695 [Brevundimonas albigilva]|uniref:hypothetical protein n=1 Tax=Brevundimonas albigilva TaxID=1312364 RepID=UPI00201B6260|nr:hypothetical protein [Brevundimonas albigilva]UQV17380.1 hypothetical protein MU852_10695 [Brevundimonas albigilva]
MHIRPCALLLSCLWATACDHSPSSQPICGDVIAIKVGQVVYRVPDAIQPIVNGHPISAEAYCKEPEPEAVLQFAVDPDRLPEGEELRIPGQERNLPILKISSARLYDVGVELDGGVRGGWRWSMRRGDRQVFKKSATGGSPQAFVTCSTAEGSRDLCSFSFRLRDGNWAASIASIEPGRRLRSWTNFQSWRTAS